MLKRRLIFSALVLTVAAPGVIAVSNSVGSDTDSARARAAEAAKLDMYRVSARAQTAQAPSAQQQSAFAILRRQDTAADRVPVDAAARFATGFNVVSDGMNIAIARRANVGNGAAWVLPGNDQTCLIANARAVSSVSTDLDSAFSGCLDDARAAAGELVIAARRSEPSPSEFVVGMVPDGVGPVAVKLSDGSSTTAEVHDNVYTVSVDGAVVESVSFATADGESVTLNP
jgi:hypothetical protein